MGSISTPDGPKWTARSGEGSGRGENWMEGGKGVHVSPLQTVLNGRPGAVRGVGGVQGEEGWVKGSRIATPDGPKCTARSGSIRRGKGQQCVVWRGEMELFCLTSSFTFRPRRVRGTGLRGGVFTFSFAFSFSFASAFSFSFALGWCTYGMREVGVVIKGRGRERAWM